MPDQENKLARLNPEQSLATHAEAAPLNLQAITERILTGEITNEKLAMIKDLVAMDAEKQFARAFNALQTETPKVQARKAVPNNDGTVRYVFAPYEEIMAQVAPMLQKHGFTVTFSNRVEDNRMTAICTLQHTSGHKRTNEFTVRIGKGPPGSSDTQADGSASTYAKRFALTNCLNIVIEKDSDARNEGESITPEQAADLKRRVLATGSNETYFLKFAGATSYETIASEKYSMLDQSLRKKERTN